MSIYRRFRLYGAVVGLAAIATLSVLLIWQQLVQQKQLLEEPMVLANVVLLGGLVSTWTSALAIYLGRRSERYAQRSHQLNQQYRRLIQNLNAGFMIHAPDTHVLMCNQTACDLLGLSMEQLLGKTAIDPAWHFMYEDGSIMPPEAYPVNCVLLTQAPLENYVLGICRDAHSTSAKPISENSSPHPRETCCYPSTWVLVNAFPEFDAKHRLTQVVVTFIDISQRKRIEAERQQAEIALRQSERTKQAIIEAIPDLLIRMHADGTYLDFISNRGFHLFDPQKTRERTNVYDILPPHLAALRMHYVALALQSEHPQNYEHEILIADQSFYEEVRIVPLLFDDVLVIVRDITARKRAEAELRSQKNFLQQVIDAVPSSIFVKDEEGRFVIVNQAASTIYGVAIDTMLGKRDLDISPNREQFKEFIAQNQRVAQTLAPITFPDQAITDRLGCTRWYQTTISPFLDEEGRLKGFIGNAVDVSDRKQAETALQVSEERLKLALEASGDGLWDWDISTGNVYHSDRYLEILGYQPGEWALTLNDWQNNVHPEDRPWVLERLEAHLRDSSHAYSCDYRVRCKSGAWTWIADYGKVVARAADGTPLRMIGAYKDISDRKQAEEDLRHQKEMFQAIVDNIPVMLALFNATGQIELVNPELEKVLGWSLENWQQEDIFSQCYPDPVYRQQVLDHMMTANGTWQDWTSQTAGGQRLETSWANVRLSNGHFVGIGQDVSDRKRKELALLQAREAAEAANLAKSLFLANMSHELRTPLNVILGFTQVMARNPHLTPDQQQDLQTIRRSGDHLLNLINDVLDLSKIETGHSTLEIAGIDLVALLHALEQMLAERAASKGIRLTCDLAPSVPPFILADAQKLRQILLNLVGNAIKFTQHGEVRLRVMALPHCPRQGSQETPAELWLQFDVMDTGSGIAEEDLESIFDAFVQARAGRQSASGTGLGLTISRKLIELMGGRITVQSILHEGSTFTVVLPTYPCEAENTRVDPGDRRIVGLAPGQPERRILVVDDQPENRLLLVRLLGSLGLAVREASDGEEAVCLWQVWHPDLIWMDIRMPGLDGYEATQRIRALEREPRSVIIALTAQACQSDRTLALAAGCNDYMSKPFCEETLYRKMQEYLGLEYRYADLDSHADGAPHPAFLLPAAPTPLSRPIADLPPDWLHALEEATLCGNDRAIAQLAALLPPEQAPLATYLLSLADQYQFEVILQLLEGTSRLDDPSTDQGFV